MTTTYTVTGYRDGLRKGMPGSVKNLKEAQEWAAFWLKALQLDEVHIHEHVVTLRKVM